MGLKYRQRHGTIGLAACSTVLRRGHPEILPEPDELMDAIGKYLTPLLMLLLLTLAIGVFVAPRAPPCLPHPVTTKAPPSWGRSGRLQHHGHPGVPDVGALIVDLLRQKGINDDYQSQFVYTWPSWASSRHRSPWSMSPLFQLGNTAASVATDVTTMACLVNAWRAEPVRTPPQFILAATIHPWPASPRPSASSTDRSIWSENCHYCWSPFLFSCLDGLGAAGMKMDAHRNASQLSLTGIVLLGFLVAYFCGLALMHLWVTSFSAGG